MNKIVRITSVMIFLFVLTLALAGCKGETSTTTTTDNSTTTTTTTEAETTWYLAGNFSGYVADDSDYVMSEVEGMDGWYTITVSLTADNRDNAYDGHYYKVTDGTWNTCYGTSNYALQPAPVSPTGGGLGSIWVYENMDLTVLFDSNTLTIYDNSMVEDMENPRIYGDFSAAMELGSDWNTDASSTLVLTDPDEDGIYEGEWTIPAYAGTSENGYSFDVATQRQYYINEWGNYWGVTVQYLFDGSAAGMGQSSYLNPTTDTVYHFAYNSLTHVTTVTEILASPIIYGDFSGWSLDPANGAILLSQSTTDENLYSGTSTIPAYTGTGEAYMMAVCLTKQLYYWEGVGSWGAGEQYLFSGDAGGMGKVTYLYLDEAMELTFTYDATDNTTDITPPSGKSVAPYEYLVAPTLYGTFTRVTMDSECWILEGDDAAVMTVMSGDATKYEITMQLNVFVAPTEGFYTEDTGYRFILVTTKANVGWGYYAGTQYTFDGNLAGMGDYTNITITETGTYHFVYDSVTNITTYEKIG